MKCLLGRFLTLLFAVGVTATGVSQEAVDFNDYYKYPVSVGFEYLTLSPFGDYGTDYNGYYDLSAVARVPLPRTPGIQALLQAGMTRFVTPERDDQLRWSHTHFHIAPGIGYSNRFAKTFELGGEFTFGLSEAIFPNLDPDESRGQLNLLSSLGIRISLNPAYNLSVDINPTIRYLHSLSPLDRFNGFVFGVGFSGHYRFGEDPDAPQAIIRSVRLAKAEFPPLFAAMQSYYAKNSFTEISLSNVDKYEISNVNVSFFQAGYMDTPTNVGFFSSISSGETKPVSVKASFNQEVFKTEGITPLTGEIIVEYSVRGRPAQQSFSVSYDLHDKTALTWDDDRKVAAFITPADSALRNYASYVRQATKDYLVSGFSEPLQIAVQIFYALKEIGCIYQVDPTSPFTKVQDNSQYVDSISLPRDTLRRLTGDCDDLTVLYNSMLESVGIETAFITVPGHIYSLFNTKVPSRAYQEVHPDQDMTFNIDGELWIPVEVTLIGTSDFSAAWRKGVEEYHAVDGEPERRVISFTSEAQEIFRPVGLRETDLGLQYGSREMIVDGFRSTLERLVDLIVESYAEIARVKNAKQAYNRLGVVSARYGRYGRAQQALNMALSLDRNYLSPLVNLGNVFFLREEYQNALRSYHKAEEELVARGRKGSSTHVAVLVNIARSYYELENYERASAYLAKAAAIDPSVTQDNAYISADGGRAADVNAGDEVLFVDEGD